MTNFTFGAVGVGILSVGVVAVSLKVAFTYLKPQFDRNFRHLEFANGTIFTQTELNTQMLTQLGREVGRIQDTITVLIGQLEEVKSSFDLNDPENLSRSSSSSSLNADAASASSSSFASSSSSSAKSTPRKSRPVVVEDVSEDESEDDEIVIDTSRASASASASSSSSSTSFQPAEEIPAPTFNLFASRSKDKGKGRLVPRSSASTSTALTTLPTDNSDRIFKQFQMAQENIQNQVAKRYEDFEAQERKQTQVTNTYAPSTSDLLSSMAKGVSSSLSSTVASVASGAPAGSQTGLVNNQYYGLIHIHGTPAVPDFLNIGKYLTSFVRTGLFSVFQSIII